MCHGDLSRGLRNHWTSRLVCRAGECHGKSLFDFGYCIDSCFFAACCRPEDYSSSLTQVCMMHDAAAAAAAVAVAVAMVAAVAVAVVVAVAVAAAAAVAAADGMGRVKFNRCLVYLNL